MILVLAIALSLDTFTAGLSYSAGKVQIPLRSMITLALVSGLTFTLSQIAGNLILFFLPKSVTRLFSFLILLSIAAYKLYDAFHSEAASGFTTSSISQKVNKKDVHILSTGEAIVLSLALSIDSISAGLSAGIKAPHPAVSFCITTAVHLIAIVCGYEAGRLIAGKISCNFSLLTAILLFFLAILRLL